MDPAGRLREKLLVLNSEGNTSKVTGAVCEQQRLLQDSATYKEEAGGLHCGCLRELEGQDSCTDTEEKLLRHLWGTSQEWGNTDIALHIGKITKEIGLVYSPQ